MNCRQRYEKDDERFSCEREGGLSFLQMSADIQRSKLFTPTEKAVYATLCLHCYDSIFSDYRDCFPSVQLIADETNCSVITVRRAIHNLKKYGAIKVIRTRQKDGRQGPNRYVLMNKLPQQPSIEDDSLDSQSINNNPVQSIKNDVPKYQKVVSRNIHKNNKKHIPPIAPQGGECEESVPGTQDTEEAEAADKSESFDLTSSPSKGKNKKAGDWRANNPNPLDEWFEQQFWPNYPRHVDKKRARNTFMRVLAKARSPEEQKQWVRNMGIRLARYIHDVADKEEQYIKHPSTWLNAHDFSEPPEENEILRQEVFVRDAGRTIR